MSHEGNKRSPQFSLAKKTGYALGTYSFKIGKGLGGVPLPPIWVPAVAFKALGILLKGAAKGGQIFL